MSGLRAFRLTVWAAIVVLGWFVIVSTRPPPRASGWTPPPVDAVNRRRSR